MVVARTDPVVAEGVADACDVFDVIGDVDDESVGVAAALDGASRMPAAGE